ncbi:MAG TPA: phosphotransferase [Kineosporiaceae bacterium]|nr:phosphotransferase [Kineosporiaceae bacterium]
MSTRSLPRPPAVAELADLLRGASGREALVDNAGKSGAYLERVTLDGQRYVVKYLDRTRDWTMRAAGVQGGVPLELWKRGLLHRLPGCLEQPIVAVATGRRAGDDTEVTALLMRDVGAWLLPVTDEPVPLADHLRIVEHMAALHARFWQAGAEIDIVSPLTRYLELSPRTARVEAQLGSDHLVPRLIGQGWPLLEQVAPVAAAIVGPLSLDPGPLVEALAATPQTLVHGNFKLDNLGVTPDARTVILDWETSGRGAATGDLAWYLAINCRRLPQSKEDSMTAYRAALERHGIDTEPWWDRQLALSLLGGLVQFGWEKAFGGLDDELAWWQQRAVAGARLLS